MSKQVCRGEIWIVDWSPSRGSKQTGMRPAVVIQTDAANRNPHYPNTILVTISTKGKAVPFHVPVNPSGENGLKEASFVKCEQVLTRNRRIVLFVAWEALRRSTCRKWQHPSAGSWDSEWLPPRLLPENIPETS